MSKLMIEEMNAIRVRSEAATPGPWTAFISEDFDYHWVVTPDEQEPLESVCDVGSPDSPRADHDAEFIAHAREDVPALLAHIDELTSEKTYHFEDAEMWRAMVDGLHAELDLLMVPRDVSAGENLMRALSLLERFRSFFMVSQFGVPDSLMESYLRDRDNFDER